MPKCYRPFAPDGMTVFEMGAMTADPRTLFNRMMGKVRLRHIQLVVLTADLGSTHKVAEEIGLSQPSVVKMLLDLERLTETQLFERHARGMRPTPACHALLSLWRSMLGVAQTASQTLSDLQSGAAGVVHIGAMPAACHGPIMSALSRFAQNHPEIHFHLQENKSAVLLEELALGTLDVLLIRQPSQIPQGYRFTPLLADHPVVLARSGHRLAGRRLDIAMLAMERWLTFPHSMTSRIVFESWFEDSPVRPGVVNITTSSLSAITSMVAESDALVLLPHSLAASALAAGRVCILDLPRREAIRSMGMLWRQDSESRAVSVFCEWMLRHMDDAPLAE